MKFKPFSQCCWGGVCMCGMCVCMLVYIGVCSLLTLLTVFIHK